MIGDETMLQRVSAQLMAHHGLTFTNPKPLARVLGRCFLLQLADQEVLCAEKEDGDELYFLLRGQVEVIKRDLMGVERHLAMMEPPTMFGHMALIEGRPRSASCRASGEAVVAVMGSNIHRRLRHDPGVEGTAFRHLLAASLGRQLDVATHNLARLVYGEAEQEQDELQSASDSLNGWTAPRARPAS